MRVLHIQGLRALITISIGQAASRFGSGMTSFALMLWAWEATGEATALALVSFFRVIPRVLMSPFAGVLVDRWNRKKVMAFSDIGESISTIVVLALFATGQLEIWHLYVTGAISGALGSFQFPAYLAATSTMVPKDQYGRANGILSLARTAPTIGAPIVAAIMLPLIGVRGILWIDLVTLAIALGTLALISVPQPVSSGTAENKRNIWQDSSFGFKYIFGVKSLLGLQLVFFVANLVAILGFTVQTPMILAKSGNDEVALGLVRMLGGVGGVAGGILLSLWGGPKRKVHGVLTGIIVVSIFGQMLMGTGRTVVAWSIAAFVLGAVPIIINGANQAIWQLKIRPSEQGRIFAARATIAQITTPIAMLIAGPLADRVFEPALRPGGVLSGQLNYVFGFGEGAGMGMILFLSGLLAALVGIGGYLLSFIRNVEDEVPDHDEEIQTASI